MTDFLREQRLAPARRSKEVFEIGMSLLYPSGSLPSEEHWNALEQLLIAALDVGRRDIAEWALQKLLQKFGKESTRVLRTPRMVETNKNDRHAVKRRQNSKRENPTKKIVILHANIG